MNFGSKAKEIVFNYTQRHSQGCGTGTKYDEFIGFKGK
jgi:hypothetical protein